MFFLRPERGAENMLPQPSLRKVISMKLIKSNISKVVVPHGKSEHIEFDDDVPGFGLRVRAGGSATWIFQYRQGSKQRRLSLGQVSAISPFDARETASKLHAKVRLGEDPAGQKIESRTRAAETFGAILQPYLAEKKAGLKRRSYEEVERHLLKHAKPLHGLQLTAITLRGAAALLTELAANNGPNLANSVRASLSALFSWTMTKGLADRNPIIDTQPADTKGARDRVLSDDELRSIWNSLGNDAYSDIVRLLTLTGQRRGEVGSLKWNEINFDKAVISLPPERTKNSRPHDIPLSGAALSILKARPCLAGRDYVFASGAHGYRGWANNKIALDANVASKGAISPWRLHDLRRTVSTRMHDELGILPHIVEAVLNHVSGHKGGVAGTYNRALYAKEKAVALARWAEHLNAIVGGTSSKVVPIRESARR
jgi:integrase